MPGWKASTTLFVIWTFISLVSGASEQSKVVSLPLYRNKERSIGKRDSAAVPLNYASSSFWLNATVGTPPQQVKLAVDTGSSDAWVFGPDVCDDDDCDYYERSRSSTSSLIEEDGFIIKYGDGSEVSGDYVSDVFRVGSLTVKKMEFAVATEQYEVGTMGIMGIGFDTNEAMTDFGSKPYRNIIDSMADQGLINSRAYSLWLNDLDSGEGNILFGGYDTEKFKGNLTPIAIQPEEESGTITTMTIPWTSLSITDPTQGTISLTGDNFTEGALLDSGTTLSYIPVDLFNRLASIANVYSDYDGNSYVDCAIVQEYKGTLNVGFGGSDGPVIPVPFSEFCPPMMDVDGNSMTLSNGHDACWFGFQPNVDFEPTILGDTFLRSAYVVYNIDRKEIAIAPTVFGSDKTNIVEIDAPSSSDNSSWSLTSGASVQETAPTSTETPGVYSSVTITALYSYTPTATATHTAEESNNAAISNGTPSLCALVSLVISIISLCLALE
ncbi:uncharacterized protein N7484_000253 [Penicillium longicatenatum]|uniref:uncharacterized protein n=1 Tax=Penicillium longicatenatum TaxID=1561947 RepID=UPI002549A64E|nr:uncharacterized protein N7484_000253 [Penicillium longicatenatum]KAJ5660881.1 hypothetical protein N7484_000253 [Penicillium longicatenatum]